MIESQFGTAENFFLVDYDNGDVYLRRELYLNSNVDRYIVSGSSQSLSTHFVYLCVCVWVHVYMCMCDSNFNTSDLCLFKAYSVSQTHPV